MVCLGMHSNLMIHLMVQAFQDPPLGSSTVKVSAFPDFLKSQDVQRRFGILNQLQFVFFI
jgi:hypothetical protein